MNKDTERLEKVILNVCDALESLEQRFENLRDYLIQRDKLIDLVKDVGDEDESS